MTTNTSLGRRNRLVEVRRKPVEDVGWGQTPNPDPGAMELVTRIHVNIRGQSGSESIRSEMSTSVVRASLRGNYRTDITADMELWHGAVRYRIKAAIPDEITRSYTDYVCEVVS